MKLQRFIKQSEIAAPPEAVFAWHELPGAVEQLTPRGNALKFWNALPHTLDCKSAQE